MEFLRNLSPRVSRKPILRKNEGIALNLQANISQSFDRVLVSLVLSSVYGPYAVLLNSKSF